MKFLEVTSQSGKNLVINLDLVTTIAPIDKDNNAEGSIIYFISTDDTIKVMDDYKALINRMVRYIR